MKIPEFLRRRLNAWANRTMASREPDRIIGEKENPYMLRWHIIPRNPIFNIYLHKFLRSDDDRALHDHPWANASILIEGNYWEHTFDDVFYRTVGFVYFRRAVAAHRVQLLTELKHRIQSIGLLTDEQKRLRLSPAIEITRENIPAITLFITGPRIREWGFLCPQGWRHHTIFAEKDGKHSVIGRGCE